MKKHLNLNKIFQGYVVLVLIVVGLLVPILGFPPQPRPSPDIGRGQILDLGGRRATDQRSAGYSFPLTVN